MIIEKGTNIFYRMSAEELYEYVNRYFAADAAVDMAECLAGHFREIAEIALELAWCKEVKSPRYLKVTELYKKLGMMMDGYEPIIEVDEGDESECWTTERESELSEKFWKSVENESFIFRAQKYFDKEKNMLTSVRAVSNITKFFLTSKQARHAIPMKRDMTEEEARQQYYEWLENEVKLDSKFYDNVHPITMAYGQMQHIDLPEDLRVEFERVYC